MKASTKFSNLLHKNKFSSVFYTFFLSLWPYKLYLLYMYLRIWTSESFSFCIQFVPSCMRVKVKLLAMKFWLLTERLTCDGHHHQISSPYVVFFSRYFNLSVQEKINQDTDIVRFWCHVITTCNWKAFVFLNNLLPFMIAVILMYYCRNLTQNVLNCISIYGNYRWRKFKKCITLLLSLVVWHHHTPSWFTQVVNYKDKHGSNLSLNVKSV